MDPWELLEAQVDAVATLGELAAIMTALHRDVPPLVYPEPLHAALRKFAWTFGDTLCLQEVTSLGYLGVTSVRQALVAFEATLGRTWASARATVRAWRESVDAFRGGWDRVVGEALDLFSALKRKDTASLTSLHWDLFWDETTGWETAEDNLVAVARQPPVAQALAVETEAREEAVVATSQAGVATRRGQWAREVSELLRCLVNACNKATCFTCDLHNWLLRIELIVELDKTSLSFVEDLVVSQDEAKWMSEGSARLATRHLLGSLRDIHNLLLSPYGGSSGPGGPGGRLVAQLCRETTKATLRLCKEQRTAPPRRDTDDGSSIPGTPEQPEGTWGKPEPGAVCDIASQLPRDPDLLPPGTRCELATSKLIRFLKDCYHEWIPIEVTGTSQQKQDFLIIGKDSNRTLGFSVIPAVVSVNCNEELRVLALAYKAPVVIHPKTPIAIAIALPMNTNKRAVHPAMPIESSNPHGRWIKRITNESPEQTCSLTHLGKTVYITGKLDTGSDVTVISYEFWPRDWNLVPPDHALTGIGGSTVCMQSESMITVTGPEGKTATVRPYVVKKRITLWGRDVMSQWRAKMEVDS